MVGADRVVLGSDYDQDMQYERPVHFLEKVPRLSARERRMILSDDFEQTRENKGESKWH